MLSALFAPTFLVVGLSSVLTQASPVELSQDLVTRANKWNLKCGNAPDVVAGNHLNQSDVVIETNLPVSGSNQQWLKYLWCTPGTQTYTFFNMGEMTPVPGSKLGYRSVYEAYAQAIIAVRDYITEYGDGQLAEFWTMQPSNTNIQLWVQNSVGKMTYGILLSALSGLGNAAANFDTANDPMVFQINDDPWGEVGIGYAGFTWNQYGQCVYEVINGHPSDCNDVANGWVKGLN